MKLTRRQLVVAAAGSAFAASAAAQSAPTASGSQAVPAATPDFAKQARDNVQSNATALAKFAISMATEPAFQFKA